MILNKKQQRQEDSYLLPYHWLISSSYDRNGRFYFGYINFCVDIAKKNGGPILDAGCGDGRFLGELSKISNTKIYGVDYSSRAIEFTKLFVPQAEVTAADLSNLPYEDNFFQQIFLIETLEHIPPDKINSILSELRRVLKKDGQLVITVPSLRLGIPKDNSKHYQHFSPLSLQQTVSQFFQINKMVGQSFDRFHILKILYRLVDNSLYDMKILRIKFNKYLYPKYLNICKSRDGRRLIALCKPVL